jgi:mannose-6-phosphate isomerase
MAQPPLASPLLFVPFLRPMVWGGRRLADELGKSLPPADAYGESWDVSDHPHHRSVVANPVRQGESLRQLMESEVAALLGPSAGRYPTFPWLVKYLDAADWLSVQVHPDEEAVRRLWPGEGSKTEAWFILDAQPGSRIYAGLLPGVTAKDLRRALQAGAVAECLHSFVPRPGDCVFLPAGTVHAVGGGVLMAEVQQTSDATFRLFDWNRRDAHGKSRPLHVEEALACIHWDRGPVEPRPAPGYAAPTPGTGRQELVRCPYFTLEYVRTSEPLPFGTAGRLQVILVVQGQGCLETATGLEPLRRGQAWVLPARMERATVRPEPDLGLLISTLPEGDP